MNQNPPEDQERIHELLQEVLVNEGEVLTAWGIVFEAQGDGPPYFGYWMGPAGVPPWRSRGMYSQAIAYMDADTVHQEFHNCENPPEPEE